MEAARQAERDRRDAEVAQDLKATSKLAEELADENTKP